MLIGGTAIHTLTFDAIETLRAPDTPERMLDRVASILGQFGFDAFVLTRLPHADLGGGPDILLNGWPDGWSERYAEAGHFRYDPLSRHCLATTEVFSWDEIPARLFADPRAAHVRHEAAAPLDGRSVRADPDVAGRGGAVAGRLARRP